ncbi:MAG: hypothetical protein JXQ73_06450 [Phycisphaerae bacterium]|nr:hypothetical protein [Phycisphaerae bacterium]
MTEVSAVVERFAMVRTSVLVASLMLAAARVVGAEEGTSRPSNQGAEARPARLPSGPEGAGRFGAYYTRLRYTDEWERPWRVGEAADVLVRFDDGGHRFFFWRGASYIPCWVTANGIWYTNEFCETSGGGTEGCAEPMSDKQARYASVRILEAGGARVVVHWRYALADVHYRIAYPDEKTGWGDWADETYTIYPDATGVRKIVLWTSRPDVWHEFQEAIVINPPGTAPEDNIETAAVSIANLEGESGDFVWDSPGAPHLTKPVPGACIEVVNLKAPRRPFVMIAPEEASISTFNGHAPNSRFNWWDHWPVSQDKSWTRVTTGRARPSHTSLSWIANPRKSLPRDWKAHERTEQSATKLLLNGLTSRSAAELAPLARSWLRPAPMTIHSKGFAGGEYDRGDRAYHVRRVDADASGALEFSVEASPGSPIVNLAVLVSDWGENGAVVAWADPQARSAPEARLGHRHRPEGTDLVIWLPVESKTPVRVRVRPRS